MLSIEMISLRHDALARLQSLHIIATQYRPVFATPRHFFYAIPRRLATPPILGFASQLSREAADFTATTRLEMTSRLALGDDTFAPPPLARRRAISRHTPLPGYAGCHGAISANFFLSQRLMMHAKMPSRIARYRDEIHDRRYHRPTKARRRAARDDIRISTVAPHFTTAGLVRTFCATSIVRDGRNSVTAFGTDMPGENIAFGKSWRGDDRYITREAFAYFSLLEASLVALFLS